VTGAVVRFGGGLFLASFAIALAAYLVLLQVMPVGWVFGVLPRMIPYHRAFPHEYIALVCAVHAVVATWAGFRFPHVAGRRRGLLILAVLVGSVLLASVPGGLLWAWHDIRVGFVPSWPRLWRKLARAAADGLAVGWSVALLSVPYYLVVFAVGWRLTARALDAARDERARAAAPAATRGRRRRAGCAGRRPPAARSRWRS